MLECYWLILQIMCDVLKKIIKKIRTDQEHLRLENEKNLRTSRQPKFTGSCIKDGTCNIQTN